MTSVKISVVLINGVKCPICQERLTGDNAEELSARLRTHMADLHKMKEISTPMGESAGTKRPSFTAPESKTEREVYTFSGKSESDLSPRAVEQRQEVTQFREPGRTETQLEKEVTTFNRSDTSEDSKLRQEVDRWKYPTGQESKTEKQVETFSGREPSMESEEKRLKSEEVDEWKYPRTGPEGERGPITNRKPMALMLNCPICGNPVYGSDDEDLSDELRFHFKDLHGIRRK